MTDAGEKLHARVLEYAGSYQFLTVEALEAFVRAELELAAVEGEEKIRIYEREHGYCECAICNTAREIVAIIRRRKE